MRHHGVEVRDLVADRGYTRMAPASFALPVRMLVEDIVQDYVDHQSVARPDYAVVRNRGKANERTIPRPQDCRRLLLGRPPD